MATVLSDTLSPEDRAAGVTSPADLSQELLDQGFLRIGSDDPLQIAAIRRTGGEVRTDPTYGLIARGYQNSLSDPGLNARANAPENAFGDFIRSPAGLLIAGLSGGALLGGLGGAETALADTAFGGGTGAFDAGLFSAQDVGLGATNAFGLPFEGAGGAMDFGGFAADAFGAGQGLFSGPFADTGIGLADTSLGSVAAGGPLAPYLGAVAGPLSTGGGSSFMEMLKKLYQQASPYKGLFDIARGAYGLSQSGKLGATGGPSPQTTALMAPGNAAATELARLTSNPEAITQLPGYQQLLAERTQGARRAMAAGGYNMSGNEMAAIANLGGAQYNEFRNAEMNRLGGQIQPALNASTAADSRALAARTAQTQLQGNSINSLLYGLSRII